MLKPVHMLSFINTLEVLNEEGFADYKKYLGMSGKFRAEEGKDIISLINILRTQTEHLNDYYIGYELPYVGKEIDILRFGEDEILCLEVKSEFNEEQIINQLRKDKHYLSALNKKVYCFTYVSSSKKVYTLNKDQKIREVKIEDIAYIINNQKACTIENLDTLFTPGSFLISPFNSTEKFLDNAYFLTLHQEEIKQKIIENKVNKLFHAIEGAAGTGKTLLAYDIAKTFMSMGLNVLIVHSGKMNEGHLKLRQYGWKVIPVKAVEKTELSIYDVILVDETQRIRVNQLKYIATEVNKNKQKIRICLFALDPVQYLRDAEKEYGIPAIIDKGCTKYKLKNKIRTNKELAEFTKRLFKYREKEANESFPNVSVEYYSSFTEVEDRITVLLMKSNDKWQYIKYTPINYENNSLYNKEINKFGKKSSETAHDVLGQEFDNVVVVMDENFHYNNKNELYYGKSLSSYYHTERMLFQMVTRTRKKLKILVYKNSEVFSKLIKMI